MVKILFCLFKNLEDFFFYMLFWYVHFNALKYMDDKWSLKNSAFNEEF